MIQIKGGNGSTKEKAIRIIGADTELQGIDVEFNYMEGKVGYFEIEMRLISIDDKPPTIDLEIESYRRNDMGKGYELSTFTAKQESIILKPENAVVLIGGLGALGLESSIDYLDLALRDLPVSTDYDTLQHHINKQQAFQRKLDAFLESRKSDLSLLIISYEVLWDESWIRYTLNKVNKRKSKNYNKKVIFLADGSMIWSLYAQNKDVYDEYIKNGLKEIRLRKISDSMINTWAHDQMIDEEEKILNSVGRWPGLHHKYLIKNDTNKIALDDPFEKSDIEILQKNLSYLSNFFGLEIDTVRELLIKVNEYNEPLGIEELYVWCEKTIPLNVLEDAIEWCKYFSIIDQDEKDKFVLDPIVAKVIGLIHER